MIIDLCVIHDTGLRSAQLGDFTFRMSPQHPVATYTVRIYAAGDTTVIQSIPLGQPTPDEDGIITVNLATTLNALAAGNYDVSVATTTSGGTTDSGVSNVFTVPLAP